MSFERIPGVAAEPAPGPQLGEASPSMRLQILSTEHWSLLASRSLAWNESFSRAGMFLTTLSGAIVALGLVGGASGFGDAFTLFALVVLPIVLFIGVATYIRLGASNYHEAQCVIGMNRIRAAYLELAPDLARYFVMSAHDDFKGIGVTMGVQPGGGRAFWLAQMIAGTPTVVMVLNAALVGAISAVAVVRAGGAPFSAVLGAAFGFLIGVTAQVAYSRQSIGKTFAAHRPLFPTP
jgi:hypothetical protein